MAYGSGSYAQYAVKEAVFYLNIQLRTKSAVASAWTLNTPKEGIKEWSRKKSESRLNKALFYDTISTYYGFRSNIYHK